MYVIGIEGTAHTFGAGIVTGEKIISNVKHTFVPKVGGIHPREAAIHHFEHAPSIISASLREARLKMSEIDLVTFSMGPGLGPCLRIAATSARSLALSHNKPIIGVNHPLGHIEIGRKLGDSYDPVILYVSGGNTQVIAHGNGRYRVFGETIDIGIGNMLDKLARHMGFPFPGGPEIEKMAGKGSKLLDMPYSVKGMDTSFSGILTAALSYLKKGETPEDVCFSVQEYSFAMLVEVLERAMKHLGKSEILLTGGVALNSRLRKMVEIMGTDAGARIVSTPQEYCMDNGAMIAEAGMRMYLSGARHLMQDTGTRQDFRIDEVDAPWVMSSSPETEAFSGSEGILQPAVYHGRNGILKTRLPKTYRHHDLDENIRYSRLRNETSLLSGMRSAGIPVPMLLDIDFVQHSMTTGRIEGMTLRDYLVQTGSPGNLPHDLGVIIGKMHEHGISHGDLTTSNVIFSEKLYLIDPSMGKTAASLEELAADLVMLEESFRSAHGVMPELWDLFRASYEKECKRGSEILAACEAIKGRRRYV